MQGRIVKGDTGIVGRITPRHRTQAVTAVRTELGNDATAHTIRRDPTDTVIGPPVLVLGLTAHRRRLLSARTAASLQRKARPAGAGTGHPRSKRHTIVARPSVVHVRENMNVMNVMSRVSHHLLRVEGSGSVKASAVTEALDVTATRIGRDLLPPRRHPHPRRWMFRRLGRSSSTSPTRSASWRSSGSTGTPGGCGAST